MSKPSNKSKASDPYPQSYNRNRIPAFRCRETDIDAFTSLLQIIDLDPNLSELIQQSDKLQREGENRGVKQGEVSKEQVIKLAFRVGLHALLTRYGNESSQDQLLKTVRPESRTHLRHHIKQMIRSCDPDYADLLDRFTEHTSQDFTDILLDHELLTCFLIAYPCNQDEDYDQLYIMTKDIFNTFIRDTEAIHPDQLDLVWSLKQTPD